jgi:hypothetical protein
MALTNAEKQARYRERHKQEIAESRAARQAEKAEERMAAEGLACTTLEFAKRTVHYLRSKPLGKLTDVEAALSLEGDRILEIAARSGNDREFQWSAAMRIKGAREAPMDRLVTVMKRKADAYDKISEVVRQSARRVR